MTAIRALIRDDEVHRSVYFGLDIFRLEMERSWARTCISVGHASQVRDPGNCITCDVGTAPGLMIRQADGTIHVLRNRCVHKGAKILADWSGHAGRSLRCPYHNWSYRTDDSVAAISLRRGYERTGFDHCEAAAGLQPVES
jgi:benzoate/toluate 1,2-dioxygenase alpha subunit